MVHLSKHTFGSVILTAKKQKNCQARDKISAIKNDLRWTIQYLRWWHGVSIYVIIFHILSPIGNHRKPQGAKYKFVCPFVCLQEYGWWTWLWNYKDKTRNTARFVSQSHKRSNFCISSKKEITKCNWPYQ